MSSDSQRLRLDEILVSEGLISQDQINEALMRQRAHGGKLGSQLLYHRYLDEAALVKALALQFKCEGVVLADLEIPANVVKMVSKKVALARKVMPFAYDAKSKVLQIACPDPTDSGLHDELRFLIKEKKIKLKLFVAAELSLQTSINRYYEGREITLEDALQIEIPDNVTDTGRLASMPELEPVAEEPEAGPRGEVLIVTDDEYAASLVQSILERDGYAITFTDSADDAIEMIGEKLYHTVFIKDTVPGDYLDLIDRLRKISPRTNVRYYESESALMLTEDSLKAEGDLTRSNLEIYTALLALKEQLPSNHSGAVGGYADKLCRKLGLPNKVRLPIITAGFMHDLAQYYYHMDSNSDQRTVIKLTARLMASINYSPVVTETLRCMYKNLRGKYTKRLPIEVLGGNILTIVDLYCEGLSSSERMSLDRFEIIRQKYEDVTGLLLLPEVVEAFCELIEEEILKEDDSQPALQVMIYADNPGAMFPVQERLRLDNYGTIAVYTTDEVATLSKRRAPDVLVMILHGTSGEVSAVVEATGNLGIDFGVTPTFVVASGCAAAELTSLMDLGVADVQAFDANLDLLLGRIGKLREEPPIEEVASQLRASATGTQGLIRDINLIDLIQAMGPARKTVQISLAPHQGTDGLVIFLRKGAIIFARLGELNGVDAMYEGVGWTDGTWWVQPIAAEDLPEPNIYESNEGILMEGCRRVDEAKRDESQPSEKTR